ncbi:MAG TPA: VCBS repeat-containing protein [Candidatus Bathyarchaeia archaeon]|nr:VCBS repeat-containing protein [Candidatus Bathyarchaeia archaeon]
MKRKRIIPLCLFLMVTSSACSIGQSPADLVKAPAAETNKQELAQIVQQLLPAGGKLTVPLHPHQSSAISLQDLDGDRQEEAIAFYRLEKNNFQLGMLILKQVAGKWQEFANMQGLGSDIDYASFTDVTGDKRPEILVGWSGGEGLSNELAVYSLPEKELKTIWNQGYTQLTVGDLTDDGVPEIAVIEHDRDQMEAKMNVYTFADNQFKSFATAQLDGTANGFDQVAIAKATPSKKGIFVDYGVGAHSGMTDLYIWEQGQLKNVLRQSEVPLGFKPYPVPSKDVNGDGIFEIGAHVEPPGSGEMAMAEIAWITAWSQWDGQNGFIPVEEHFTDYQAGYDFTIPTEWKDQFTVKKENNGDFNTIRFFTLEDQKKEILTFEVYKKADWLKREQELKEKQQTYTVLHQATDITIAAVYGKLDKDHPLNLTEEKLKKHFQIMQTEVES